MTLSEQNRAIAEWFGWTDIGTFKDEGLYGCPKPNETDRERIPDYTSDLNAIHEAEKNLKDELRGQYEDEMLPYNPTYATAAQRSEALLRTIGKWKE